MSDVRSGSSDKGQGAVVGFTRRWTTPLVVCLIAAALPFIFSSFAGTSSDLILLYILVAIAINFAYGYGGQFVVAQPLIMAVSAYAAGILSLRDGWGPLVTLPFAIVTAVVANLIVSAPGLRLRGWYLAITSFFAVLIVPDLITATQTWTGGSNGLAGLLFSQSWIGQLNTTPIRQYEFLLVIVAVVWIVVRNAVQGRWGTWLRALRDAPIAAEACGVRIIRVKISIAVATGIIVGIAGWQWTYVNSFVSPDSFGVNLLLLATAAVFLGGRGTLWGPLIGTVIFEAITLKIGQFSEWNPIFLGASLVVISAIYPQGLVPGVKKAFGAVKHRVAKSGSTSWWTVPFRSRAEAPREASDETAVAVFDSEATTISHVTARLEPEAGALDSAEKTVPVLNVVEVRKGFGGISVLNGVSMDIHRGECVGLIGGNGSGKTTLLNVVTGFVRLDAGNTFVSGVETTRMRPQAIAAQGVRRSFQTPQLIDELTVRQNIRLGAATVDGQATFGSIIRGPRYRSIERVRNAEIDAACDLLGISSKRRNDPVESLPLGMKRTVEIARAVVSKCVLICLDEPAAGLMGSDLDKLLVAFRSLVDSGYSILLIEHNLRFVGDVADRVVEMDLGVVKETRGDYRSEPKLRGADLSQ
ncbi:MAG: ATP-binding cassette domain-containing protein [Acidimicrobiales bacterium]